MLWQVTKAAAQTVGQQSDGDADSVRRVAVLTHMGRPAAIAAANRLVEGLSAAGIVSALPAGDLPALDDRLSHSVMPLSKPVKHEDGIELMVVLGGDGTILRGTEWVLASEIPLLGVNLGHVGFLAEAESSEIDSIVTHVVNRSYTVEERFTIDVTLRDSKTFQPAWSSYAINEVSIEKAARERMLEVLVEVDGRPLSRWACDGVLVSTPTGSTAYAFSAGGPVVWPDVEALLLVPTNAHALFARPLVTSPTSVLTVAVPPDGTRARISADGRRIVEVPDGGRVEVRRSDRPVRIARVNPTSFGDRLVAKFGLPVRGFRDARSHGPGHEAPGWRNVLDRQVTAADGTSSSWVVPRDPVGRPQDQQRSQGVTGGDQDGGSSRCRPVAG